MTGLRGNEPDLTGAEQKFMREEKQAIFSTAVGLARLRLQHGDLQGASDVLDDACDEAHVKHFDACIKDGYTAENVERLLGPREQKVKRVPTGGNEPDLDATAVTIRQAFPPLGDERGARATKALDTLVGRVRAAEADLERELETSASIAAERAKECIAAEARVAQLETAIREAHDGACGCEDIGNPALCVLPDEIALPLRAALVSAGQGDTP